MKRTRKLLVTLLIFAVTAAFLPACSSTQSSSAKVTNPALVSKVTKYEIDYSSDAQDWVESSVFEYEYKDAYPVTQKLTEFENTSVTNFEYEMADGKPVSLTYASPNFDGTYKVSYTKKGLVNRNCTYDSTGRKIGEQVFQYGNRDEYFTFVLHENIISPPEDPVLDHMEETDSIIVTTENGLLRKTVNDGLFANYNDDEEKIWRRFDGSYTVEYDENGIVSVTSALFKNFPGSGNQNKFDLTVVDGRVTEVLMSNWVPVMDENADQDTSTDSEEADETAAEATSEGSWEPYNKFVFEYTDTEISPARYASMINYFLLEGGGNYYIYNWY